MVNNDWMECIISIFISCFTKVYFLKYHAFLSLKTYSLEIDTKAGGKESGKGLLLRNSMQHGDFSTVVFEVHNEQKTQSEYSIEQWLGIL